MANKALDAIVTPQIIIISILVVFLIPLVLHYFAYRSKSKPSPSFLLTGPQDTGKTSLLTLLQSGSVRDTQTSLVSSKSNIVVTSIDQAPKINENDDNADTSEGRRITLIDTPGHPKLRPQALDRILETTIPVSGIIFFLDSASLSSSSKVLTDTVDYLYTLLLTIQKRCLASTGSTAAARNAANLIPVLIGCNKGDLFTALPASKISKLLEAELEKMRESKAKGLVDVADAEADADMEVLGEDSGIPFTFSMMEEVGLSITVKSGSVKDGKVKEWLEWIDESLN